MMRIWLIALICAVFAAEATAQVVYNPNSPRARRDFNPPTTSPQQGDVGDTLEPSRWGTYSGQVGNPQWGGYGGAGPPNTGSGQKFRIR